MAKIQHSASEKPKKRRKKEKTHKLVLRPLREQDYGSFKQSMDAAYPTLGGAWRKDQYLSQLEHFPDGQLCIEDKGEVIAAAISVVVDYDLYGDDHSYREITGDGYLTTHDPSGDTLYGVDHRSVHPAGCQQGTA